MSRRTERIGEQIRAEVARILREEITDPRVGLLTLTRVDVAPDLSNANVFWSAVEQSGGPSLEDTERGLASAAGFLRSRLARVLPTRRVPELRFHYDPSLEAGSRTLELLAELREGAEKQETGDGS